jgi:hypothetical protein
MPAAATTTAMLRARRLRLHHCNQQGNGEDYSSVRAQLDGLIIHES